MNWWKKKISILVGLLVLGFSSVVFASSDPTPRILSVLQGQWYDQNGSMVFDFQGNTVNGCSIVGAYHVAGGHSNFSCVLRIVEAGGYRDLLIGCDSMFPESYHSHVIFYKQNKFNPDEAICLLKTKEPQFNESVGGICLDMTEEAVQAKYGSPDFTQPKKDRRGQDVQGDTVWVYQKLGMTLTMCYHRVEEIRIYRNGDRHFDRTGFNCANLPAEFQEAYDIRDAFGRPRIPKYRQYGPFHIGHGEYMWFDDYPDSIRLNTYWS